MRPAVFLFAACAVAQAHDPITTKLLWTQEISRLINKRCVICHREGGGAMSLATYEEARPWAKAIRDEVTSRRMPPWGPVGGVGEFKDDPSLSQIEIDMIVNWVEGGAPEGDEKYLPPAPTFPAERKAAQLGRELAIASGAPRTLEAAVRIEGIRPVRVAAGDSFEVTAAEPDGAVHRLIWIRGWRPEWERTFRFKREVELGKGTKVVVYSGKESEAALILGK